MVTRADHAWTQADDDNLRANYQDATYAALSVQLNRSVGSIRNRRYRLDLDRKRIDWGADEEGALREWYARREGQSTRLSDLARQLGRSRIALALKASELGLTERHRSHDDMAKSRMSAAQTQWLKTNGHPRGFLGGRHTDQAKALVGLASKRNWESVTDEEREARIVKGNRSRIERYTREGASFVFSRNTYSRTNGGRREDLDNCYFRSSWEANYARYLRAMKTAGMIADWVYEPDRFIFHGVTRGALSYTPDFRVTGLDGAIVYHEIKGWMDSASKTRLKRIAQYYPTVTVLVIGKDEYMEIARQGQYLPGWEAKRTV